MVYSRKFILVILLWLCGTHAAWADANRLDDTKIIHFLNRMTFGATADDIAVVKKIGIDAYLSQQMNPQRIADSVFLNDALRPFRASANELADIRHELSPKNRARLKQDDPDRLMSMQRETRDALQDVVSEKIIRAAYAPTQLEEVMTDFWFNHFNVFAQKGPIKFLLSDYEKKAIRPFVFGKFRDLLGATAHHPAMLIYLDNQLNTDPDSDRAGKKKNGINENYAREVMELHTLGVDAGYTQKDVTVLAHILTGWGVKPNEETGGEFMFFPRRHDAGDKQFLGVTIHGESGGGGEEEFEQALDMLARHPSTAKHISLQLAQFFVADEPPKALVDAMTRTFISSDGNIAAVLQTMVHHDAFWDKKNVHSKFKSPFRYIVSAMRTGHITLDEMKPVLGTLRNLGDLPYFCLTPNGYPSTNMAWMNSDALLKRIEIARMLVNRSKDDVALAPIMQSFGDDVSASTRNAIDEAMPKQQPVIALSSPEFLYY